MTWNKYSWKECSNYFYAIICGNCKYKCTRNHLLPLSKTSVNVLLNKAVSTLWDYFMYPQFCLSGNHEGIFQCRLTVVCIGTILHWNRASGVSRSEILETEGKCGEGFVARIAWGKSSGFRHYTSVISALYRKWITLLEAAWLCSSPPGVALLHNNTLILSYVVFTGV